MIKFTCSNCAQSYRVSDEYAGKRVRCKACNNINTIPAPKPEVSANEDSITAYNNLLLELSKAEKQAPTVEVE
jgi:predicted Zn finger-like uncharacterized protein